MTPCDLAQRTYEFGVAVVNLCMDVGLTSRAAVAALVDEANQLTKIFIATQLTAKRRER